MTVVHTFPTGDVIEHDTDGDACPCGPRVEPVKREDGSIGWHVVHHSLDNREAKEKALMVRTHHPSAYGDDHPALNTDPPAIRCGMCGGRARTWKPGWIECASGFPGEGRCAWSSHDPRRRRHPLWWRLRVWLGR